MIDLTKMTPAEVIAERDRRLALRRQGLPLADQPSASRVGPFAVAAPVPSFVPYQDPSDFWVQATLHVRRVSLPWSLLVSDNERSQPVIAGGKVRMVLSKRYKEAKEAARVLLLSQVGGNPPLAGRVRVEATLIEPNASRVRDLSNWAKEVHDVLSGIAYEDDGQIDVLTWQRGVPDIDRPRLLVAVEEVYP